MNNEQAFHDWNSGEAYWSPRSPGNGKGDYRLKSSGRIAPWSKSIKAQFPDVMDFHAAAKAVKPAQRQAALHGARGLP